MFVPFFKLKFSNSCLLFVAIFYYFKSLDDLILIFRLSRMPLTFCDFTVDNRVKAGQLGVMEALLEALSLHKANAEVANIVAGAIGNICNSNGIDQRHA